MCLLKIVVPCIAKRNLCSTKVEQRKVYQSFIVFRTFRARRINWSCYYKFTFQTTFSKILLYCSLLLLSGDAACETFILSLCNTMDKSLYGVQKSKNGGGHLFNEKVMSQELCSCWEIVIIGTYIQLKIPILLCLIEA